MNIVICDPSSAESQYISDYLSRFFERYAEETLIFCFLEPGELIEYLSVSPDVPHLAILSIEQTAGDGIALAEKLSGMCRGMRIALTGKPPRDLERLYELEILYFLPWPVKSDSLVRLGSKLLRTLLAEKEKYLNISNKKCTYHIAYSDILYVMSDKRKLCIYQPRSKVDEFYMKLDDLETALGSKFVRCHQSYLVNMDYIHGITADSFILVDNISVPISQKKYWPSKKTYVEYVKNRG
ncbi:MAG: LytTR family transcriptional regulator DNA-binding domain-containing protein [Lachnospiraceae bacterium]|nr:LytTR family transcriptional regulator DNA-binding domain-containing protein [Lachnospiraceae bacterium]